MSEQTLLQRLKERKLVQWAVAYLAGAFVVVQLLDALEGALGLTPTIERGILVIVGIGFFITLVLAWYHGEKGRQRVSGPELLMVAALLVVAGTGLSLLREKQGAPEQAETTASVAVEDDRPSIAVLPFQDFSTDTSYAFFANGIQEQILSSLSDISALRVISRSSVMRYAETRPASGQIAEDLGVRHLVEGSVRVSGGQVRLSVQLINAARDEHVWAEDYDREVTAERLFEVQSEVAQQIAFEVGVTLTPAKRDSIAVVLTENTEAYLLFMEGKLAYLGERRSGWVLADYRSTRLLSQAVDLDPAFALAHAYLALSLSYTSPDEVRYERARDHAERALSLMPGLGEARIALGLCYVKFGDGQQALRQFQVAEAESPNLAMAPLELGLLQQQMGQFDAGLRALRRAEYLDPFDGLVQRALARGHIFAHRYDDALKALEIFQAVSPASSIPLYERAWIYLLRGEPDSARMVIDQHLQFDAGGFYTKIISLPFRVVVRLLTVEDQEAAIAGYLDYWAEDVPCLTSVTACLNRAIQSERARSSEAARPIWDSLRTGYEERSPTTWTEIAEATLVYQYLGEEQEAIRLAEALVDLNGARRKGEIEDRFWFGPSGTIFLAQTLAHFEEYDRAIDLLEEVLPAPSWLSVPLLEIDPIWDPIRDHPRFQTLLEKYADDVEH